MAVFSQWQGFGSGRGFYRYARRHLRGAFPCLPERGQFNRLMRHHAGAVVACFRHLVRLLHAQRCAYALDGTAAVTRDAQ
ncbi:MAG: hypothetical protein ABTR54_08400 [Candidatus Competibacter sp.]|nr:hypothetical protein [Candidatus Competibacter sp.]MCC9001850.1 hypothetical protein [Candidatus Competibacter sp.]